MTGGLQTGPPSGLVGPEGAMVTEEGEVSAALDDPREGRRALLRLIADGEHLIELRCRHQNNRWIQRWGRTVEDADEIAASMTSRADVYVGLAPRLGHKGEDARRYAPVRALWADCDTRRAVANLEAFDPPPTAIVLSGGADGDVAKRHAYWALTEPLAARDVKRHARRLGHCLGADLSCAEPARILRVPGSRNHKTGKVATLETLTGEVHELDAITGGLEDPPRGGWGKGEQPVIDQVPSGEMYVHLGDLATRLARAGIANADVIERVLVVEFEAVRVLGDDYGDPKKGRADTRSLAEWASGSEIAKRKRHGGKPRTLMLGDAGLKRPA